MPRNDGANPFADADDVPRVDIRLRNGHVVRDTEPGKWRWKPWPWGQSEWDIIGWQIARG